MHSDGFKVFYKRVLFKILGPVETHVLAKMCKAALFIGLQYRSGIYREA